MKKVRVTVSDFMFEILKGDAEYFKIPLGKIGNTLFKYFIDKNLSKIKLEESSGKKVQFNLSKENEDIFFDVLREKKASTEAELMRDIFFIYINNLRFKREEIIFNNTFKQIREAIKNNRKIGIKYHSTARIVNPYFIEVSSKENRAYLFCYCEKNQDFRNYRISDIETEIYYTLQANSIEGWLSGDNAYLRRKIIAISKDYQDDETYIFIRAIKPDIIEYCVSTEKKIKKNEFIEEPEEIKLV